MNNATDLAKMRCPTCGGCDFMLLKHAYEQQATFTDENTFGLALNVPLGMQFSVNQSRGRSCTVFAQRIQPPQNEFSSMTPVWALLILFISLLGICSGIGVPAPWAVRCAGFICAMAFFPMKDHADRLLVQQDERKLQWERSWVCCRDGHIVDPLERQR